MTGVMTRGVLYVHSAPRALCPHVEWAAESVLRARVSLDWAEQPVAPGLWRAECAWRGPQGTGALLASALRGWEHLRFEVTEEPSSGVDGGRWSYTPALGIFHAVTDAAGDVVVPENRIRAALENARVGGGTADLLSSLGLALGAAWDDELEPFRYAGEDDEVRWLHTAV